jgi:sialate O-acetylesterase
MLVSKIAITSRWILVIVIGLAVFPAGGMALWGDDAPAAAKNSLSISQLFGSHAVVQRGTPIPIWGWGVEGESVNVDFAGEHGQTSVKQGAWRVVLPALPAGGPYKLTVASGSDAKVVDDIYVGDVWLAGGQSNMQCFFSHAPELLARPDKILNPQVHVFSVDIKMASAPLETSAPPPRPISINGWKMIGPGDLRYVSMIAYCFASEAQKRQNVPVGVIISCQGSTPIEAWMPETAVQQIEPEDKPLPEGALLIEKAALSAYFKAFKPIPAAAFYNAMIAPLIGYPLTGVLWYQGENNAGHPINYSRLLAGLVGAWRQDWHSPDLPFIIDQLASNGNQNKNDRTGESYAWLREQQQVAVDQTPNTGLTVIYDLGEYGDTHSHAKPAEAHRMVETYFSMAGNGPRQLGPRYLKSDGQGARMRVSFETHGHKLQAAEVVMNKQPGFAPGTDPQAFHSPAGTLVGFTVCGPDHHFVDATATIDGASVVVSSPQVSQPVAVRYAWSNFTMANLFDDAGFPAAPFRTDAFSPPGKLATQAPGR